MSTDHAAVALTTLALEKGFIRIETEEDLVRAVARSFKIMEQLHEVGHLPKMKDGRLGGENLHAKTDGNPDGWLNIGLWSDETLPEAAQKIA